MVFHPLADASPADRMSATLTAMGAGGWIKKLDYALLAYDPQTSALSIVLDDYWYGEETAEAQSAAWQAVCRYLEAAGSSGAFLEFPGDREIFTNLDGELVIPFREGSILGRRWKMTSVLSWSLRTPGAPWVPEAGDTYLTPESPEVAAHALASDPDFIAAVAQLRRGQN